MDIKKEQIFVGERALFSANNLKIENSIFEEGESPLKEASEIKVNDSIFKWKYPLWYSENCNLTNSFLVENARAGIWYAKQVVIEDTTIAAPKNLRRSQNIVLHNVSLPNASETLWMCQDIEMKNVTAKGEYFALNSENIVADNFTLTGNYSFDGCKNVKIRNSQFLCKDAFWNCENVEVHDSFISGEYIGWNSKNLTFVNCTIESLQGFCYIDGLTLINCRLLKTDLAFEYCENISADITSSIVSIKNPISGKIHANSIGEIIFDDPEIDAGKTVITTGELKYAI